MTFFTIGHSNRSTEDLLALLESCGIVHLADVRSMPGSRSNPQFDGEVLAADLAGRGITYEHFPGLGGLRRRNREVPEDMNGFWKNRSFHNYADHALGGEFAVGLERLRLLGGGGPCAILCAEAVWWRCHRRIIADHLIHRGERVCHILGPGNVQPAALTAGAAPDPRGRLVYPPPPNDRSA